MLLAFQMKSASEYVLYTAIRKIDLNATLSVGSLLPRYTQFRAKVKPYVGLREDMSEVWTSRIQGAIPNAQPDDFLIIKVIIPEKAFMMYATETYVDEVGKWAVPRFYKAWEYGHDDYGAWRFYGGIPLNDGLIRFEPYGLGQ